MVSNHRNSGRRPTRELLSRTGRITKWRLSVYIHAKSSGGVRTRDSSQYLVIEGKLTEPLNGVSDFYVQLSPETEPSVGNREMPSVAAVLRVKPRVEAAGSLAVDEFRTVVTLASTGTLTSFVFAFEKPSRGKALVASMGFHSDLDPEEESSELT